MEKNKTLVIVESPTKAKTINKYLGKDYVVKSSMGHLIDLPKSRLAVDVENGFEPDYITIRGRGRILTNCVGKPAGAIGFYLRLIVTVKEKQYRIISRMPWSSQIRAPR